MTIIPMYFTDHPSFITSNYADMNKDRSFSKNQRVLTEREYKLVKKRGSRKSSPNLVLLQHKNNIRQNRLGIIVTRKVGKANIRNRWKRYLREFFRTHKDLFADSFDSVFIVKRDAKLPRGYAALSKELFYLLKYKKRGH